MRVAVTGSRGLIGSALVPVLMAGGHGVTRIVHGAAVAPGDLGWDARQGIVDPAPLEELDAVVHLAGASIAAGRWTAARKEAIRSSRVEGTQRLAATLAGLARPPRVLACASAIGFYGDRGRELLDETSAPGRGFLAAVCRDWEGAAAPAVRRGIRVVNLRFGMVLSAAGGALAQMLTPFRLGAGGALGDGEQVVSWIAIEDAVGALLQALEAETLAGAVNAVAPSPVTNRELARTLARVLGRPAFLNVPAFALRLAWGELADELLLASQRVRPARLLRSGYRFHHPELEGALRHLLGRRSGEGGGMSVEGSARLDAGSPSE